MEAQPFVDWNACWIWQPDADPTSPNKYVYFRHQFELEAIPDQDLAQVSADTCYQLFINGKFVGRGPVMTEPRWQTYDSYDVAHLLKAGANTIAAVVYHYGTSPNSDQAMTFIGSRGGFLFKLDLDRDGSEIVSDEGWWTREATAWGRDVPKIDRMAYCEFFDGRKEPSGWLGTGCDERGWRPAVPIKINPILEPWNWNPADSVVFPWIHLGPRPLTRFELNAIAPAAILYSGEVLERAEPFHTEDLAVRMSLEKPLPVKYTWIERIDHLLESNGAAEPTIVHPFPDDFTIREFPGVHDPLIALDAGRLMNGRVRIELTAPAGTVVDIGYSQLLVDYRVIPYLSHQTNPADQFITREGRQELKTFNWRSFRYVLIVLRNFHEPVEINRIVFEQERYPYEKRGAFACNDAMLNWTWQACADSIEAGTYDRLMDNPVRERRQYLKGTSKNFR